MGTPPPYSKDGVASGHTKELAPEELEQVVLNEVRRSVDYIIQYLTRAEAKEPELMLWRQYGGMCNREIAQEIGRIAEHFDPKERECPTIINYLTGDHATYNEGSPPANLGGYTYTYQITNVE